MEPCYEGLRAENVCGEESNLEDFKEHRRRNEINGVIIN
jgi:hypothetical protein